MANTATVGLLRILLTANTAEFDSALKHAASSADRFSKDLRSIGQQATQVGAALTKTITLPLLGLGVGAAKAAMDFESSFANVAKTVDGVSDRAGVLTEEGKKLALTFRQMAKEIPATTDELNAIAALGGQMGVPIDKLEQFTRNIAALGVAVDGISAEEAAAGLAQIGNIFGKGTTKIAEMSSALVHLGNNSNATEGQILEFTKRLAGAGNTIGLTEAEVMALGTAMADVGINAEAGGTAMSQVIAKMSTAVSNGGAKLEAFAKVAGKSAEDFAALWRRKPIEAIDLFVKGLSDMRARGVDLNLTMGELGTSGIRQADTLKRLAGAGDGVARSLKIANEGFEAADKHLEEAEKKYATTANQLKVLWNQIKDVGITLGDALIPAIKSSIGVVQSLVPVIETLARGFAAMPESVQGGIIALAALLAAIGPAIYIAGQLAISAAAVTAAFGKKGIATRLLTGELVTLGGVAKGLPALLGKLGLAGAAVGAAVAADKLERSTHDAVLAAKRGEATWRDLPVLLQNAISRGLNPFGAVWRDTKDAINETRSAWEAWNDRLNQPKAVKSPMAGLIPDTSHRHDLDALIKLMGEDLPAATTKAAAGTKEVGSALAVLRSEIYSLEPEQVSDLTEKLKSGAFTVKQLAKEFGVSQEAIKLFKKDLSGASKELKTVEKAQKDAAKAADEHRKELDRLDQVLAKQGILTVSSYSNKLGDLVEVLNLASRQGADVLRMALIKLAPEFAEIEKQARASGLAVGVASGIFNDFAAAAGLATLASRNFSQALMTMAPDVKSNTNLTREQSAALVQAGKDSAATAEAMKRMGVTSRAELIALARQAEADFDRIEAAFKRGEVGVEEYEKALKKLKEAQKAALGETRSVWDTIVSGWEQAKKNLTSSLEQAFGSWVSGAQNFADSFVQVFQQVAKDIGRVIGDMTSNILSELGGLLGKLAGPLGAIVSGLIGGLLTKLGNWLFKTESRAANDIRDQFFMDFGERHGGFKPGSDMGSTFQDVATRLTAAGHGPGGGELFRRLIQADDPQELAQAIAAVNRALEEYERRTESATAAEAAHSAEVSKAKEAYQQKIDGLRSSLKALDDEEAALNASEKPEKHMGTVEKRARARIDSQRKHLNAQLDAVQKALAEAVAAIVSGAEQGFDGMADAAVDAFSGIPAAAREAARKAREAFASGPFGDNLRLEFPKMQGFHGGTPNLDFMDFGSGRPAMLHGREAVVPESKAGEFAAKHFGGAAVVLQVQAGAVQVNAGRHTNGEALAPQILSGLVKHARRGGPAADQVRALVRVAGMKT